MKKYLVIAYYDGDLTPVKNVMRELAQDGQATFHVIVPATPSPSREWTWTEEEAYQAALRRLNSQIEELKSVGGQVNGQVLNYSALAAVEEALQKATYDEVIVSTPPAGITDTSYDEYEHHIRRLTQIPIRYVVNDQARPIARA
ncbi:MAG TPA: hypothetical protein VFD70_01325 [Anaerolineae bacterium]|nr:hypothetical protein [Anaerolineae bacterium]